jgi:serine/threonine protein kinase
MQTPDLAGMQLGDYHIESILGAGGMGMVYKAHQILLNRPVAIKILSPSLSSDFSFVKRFQREAWAVAQLNHQNIVQIYEVGESEGIHFFSMEWVDGRDLNDIIMRKGCLPIKQAIRIITKVARAIEHAHQHNIIHRDIKPSNIMIGSMGQVKVTDFGLARTASETTKLTESGMLIGTLDYMSPEQCRGEALDCRADVYAVGAVLYELLTGKKPFHAENQAGLIHKIICDVPSDVRSLNPKIPSSLSDVLAQAMAKNRVDRYASMSELKKALSHVARSMPKAHDLNSTDADPQPERERTVQKLEATELGLSKGVIGAWTETLMKSKIVSGRKIIRISLLHIAPACCCLLAGLLLYRATDAQSTRFIREMKGFVAHLTEDSNQKALSHRVKQEYENTKQAVFGQTKDIKPIEKPNETGLIWLALRGDLEGVSTILNEEGADPNTTNSFGETALFKAAGKGHTDLVNLLLAKGADVNIKDINGMTAMIEASRKGRSEVVEILHSRGADINTANKYNYTALMYAVKNGQAETVNILLNKGADPNIQNEAGWTALMFAMERAEIANMLLANGADVDVKDKKGETVLEKATKEGLADSITLFLDHTVDRRGISRSLILAEKLGHTEITQKLKDALAEEYSVESDNIN